MPVIGPALSETGCLSLCRVRVRVRVRVLTCRLPPRRSSVNFTGITVDGQAGRRHHRHPHNQHSLRQVCICVASVHRRYSTSRVLVWHQGLASATRSRSTAPSGTSSSCTCWLPSYVFCFCFCLPCPVLARGVCYGVTGTGAGVLWRYQARLCHLAQLHSLPRPGRAVLLSEPCYAAATSMKSADVA
eukprot:155014-Rhodomonas_salina.3